MRLQTSMIGCCNCDWQGSWCMPLPPWEQSGVFFLSLFDLRPKIALASLGFELVTSVLCNNELKSVFYTFHVKYAKLTQHWHLRWPEHHAVKAFGTKKKKKAKHRRSWFLLGAKLVLGFSVLLCLETFLFAAVTCTNTLEGVFHSRIRSPGGYVILCFSYLRCNPFWIV